MRKFYIIALKQLLIMFYSGVIIGNSCSFCFMHDQLAFNKLTILTKGVKSLKVSWEHYAVMRSLKAGLEKLNIPYNYNPSSYDEIGDVVLVPCNNDALQDGLTMKRNGRIKKLIVGPNFYPQDVNYFDIDIFLVPSAPFIKFFEDMGSVISTHCRVAYAGVDPEFWVQDNNDYLFSRNVLVYWKTEPIVFCEDVEKILKQYGWNPIRLRYGHYNIGEYKEILKKCRFAVFISRSESQGLALAECWAMNIPTIPWNPFDLNVFGRHFDYISACPYLNSQLGKDWKTLDELENILKEINILLSAYSPREWTLKHMTDEAAVTELIWLINQELQTNKDK